jgi:NADPH:quinone reductase
VPKRVQEITHGAGVPFALDAVAGLTGLDAVRCLGRGGRVLVYGTLSGEPIPLDLRTLMVGQKRVEGFWLSEWVRDQGVLTMLGLFRNIIKLLRADVLTTPVGTAYPLDDFRAAVRAAETPGRAGKVLIRFP